MLDDKEEIQLIKDVAGLISDMKFVYKQVENHIPTAIEKLDGRLDKIETRLAWWGGGIAFGLIALELILRFI
jgi:hypothetical protein